MRLLLIVLILICSSFTTWVIGSDINECSIDQHIVYQSESSTETESASDEKEDDEEDEEEPECD